MTTIKTDKLTPGDETITGPIVVRSLSNYWWRAIYCDGRHTDYASLKELCRAHTLDLEEVERAARADYVVVEDNGGGLHLYVFRGEKCVFAAEHYEYRPRELAADIKALSEGAAAIRLDDFDGGEAAPQASWDQWTEESRRNGGWKVIADQDGPIQAEKMGAAGASVFYAEARK